MSAAADDSYSWIDAPKENAGQVLLQYARLLESRNETRITNLELYAAMYSEQLAVSLRPSRSRHLQTPTAARNGNLTLNVARSIVDTEHAEITQAEPRPMIITEGGDREQQDQAEEFQHCVDGVFSDLRVYDVMAACEIDKNVFGTCVTKVHRMGARPRIERVLISDMLIDEDLMGPGADPHQAIHRIETSREAALVWMKDQPDWVKKAIRNAPAAPNSGVTGRHLDLIVLYDAYSLPYDEENPGKHGICVEGEERLLFVEEWTKPRLPFVFQRWQRPRTGFYGVGIIEQLLGIQLDINRFLRTISTALKRFGVPTAFVPIASNIDTQLFRNDPRGQFIPFDSAGGAPVFWNQAILSPEVMAYLQWMIEQAYKVTGVPQNVAFAEREPGIPSAEGQRNISQKAASRLNPQSRQYERAFVDVTWLLDDVLREIYEDGGELEISSAVQGALHKVDLPTAMALKPGTYKVDVFPGNLLSRHPATRAEEVMNYTKAGMFTPEEAKALTQMPDVTAALGKPMEVEKIYRKYIELALRKGVMVPPEDFWPDLELGKKLYTDALFEEQASGRNPERLQLLRDWLVKAKDIMEPATPEDPNATMQPGAPPPPPGAPPMQPPPPMPMGAA